MSSNPTPPAPTAAEHLERLQELADRLPQSSITPSLRWAIAELSRLSIGAALRLARDEGKRVRCKGWNVGGYIRWDEGTAEFFCVDDNGVETEIYSAYLDDVLAEWEEVPDDA